MELPAKLKKNPSKVLAVELCAMNPEMTVAQIAGKIGVSKSCLENWKREPAFIDAVYDRYMLQFGLEIPQVLDSMLREAKAGNVQAGRLVLEHSGKLVKNINVTIDSPFEKFLKSVPDAEVVEDAVIVESASEAVNGANFEGLPERNTENQRKREVREKQATKKLIKKAEYNAKQKVWYKWRKRAEAVGVPLLKNRRPTPAQRKDWEKLIIAAEDLRNTDKT
jgi:hypothetical protein